MTKDQHHEGLQFAPVKKKDGANQYGHEYATQVQLPNSGTPNVKHALDAEHTHLEEE